MAPSKPWTENEKVSLLVQVILALNDSFPFSKVKLAGRAPKSLTHAWTHAREQHFAYLESCPGGDDQPVTPSPSRAKNSKKRKIEDTASDDEEDIKPRYNKMSLSSPASKNSARSPKTKIKADPDSSSNESKVKVDDEA
ncbi:hypothetical protein F5Y02DRAFT_413015 [Annulohypoxylon stygium]|nr:hypothetical protein F5Y02DRAFT_413015 [Annulohypoxylon stygium]